MTENKKETKTCKCGVEIRFLPTRSGKYMPVECDPVKIMTDDGTLVKGWVVHFGRCPHSQEFSGKGKR